MAKLHLPTPDERAAVLACIAVEQLEGREAARAFTRWAESHP